MTFIVTSREESRLPKAEKRKVGGTFATNIIEERQPNGVVNKLFLHGPQADEHLMYFNASTGGLYFYYADETNSTSLLLDPAGTPVEFYTYDVYGAPSVINSVVDNPYMFTGREWDSETGTYYYRARQYSPLLGRFLQRDPIGYYDSMNLYQYAFNSPNNFIDPWGLYLESPSDLYSWQLSMYQLSTDPSLVTGAFALWDSIALVVPGMPGFGGYAGTAMKVGKTISDVAGPAAGEVCELGAKKMTTVLGHLEDTMNYFGKDGFNVLNISNWNWEKNVQWLDEAISRGDIFQIVTDKIRLGSIAEKEIKYLESRGYVRKGKNMSPQ